MLIHLLLQTIPTTTSTTPPKVLNTQTLQTMGTALAGTASLTPVFSGLGQVLKQHPKIKNDHLRWLLPVIAFFCSVIIVIFEIRSGASPDALTVFLIIGMFVGAASTGAEALYKTGILPPGPDNHPSDAAAAANITTTPPVTNIAPSNVPNAPQVPVQVTTEPSEAPLLPPSNFHPPTS